MGLIINTPHTPIKGTMSQPNLQDIHVHSAYIAQQHLDALAHTVANTIKWKMVFDRRVMSTTQGEVVFKPGQLVQVYASEINNTFKSSQKLVS